MVINAEMNIKERQKLLAEAQEVREMQTAELIKNLEYLLTSDLLQYADRENLAGVLNHLTDPKSKFYDEKGTKRTSVGEVLENLNSTPWL